MYICSMKKNTLLYLDARLVAKAKQCHLNLSKITEDAVKSHLFPMLSIGEKAETDFWNYLKELEKDKCAFFLPVRIERIKLANIGPIKNITINFNKFNLIIGNNASGKTTLIRSIAYVFGHEMLKEYFSEKATIELDVHPENKYKLGSLSTNSKENIKCVLIDSGGSRFDKQHFKKFFDYLKKLKMQVIMTEAILEENVPHIKIKVIKLPNPNN